MTSKYDLEHIASMMRKGAQYAEIAAVYNTTKSAIAGFVKRNAVELQSVPRNPPGFHTNRKPLVLGVVSEVRNYKKREPKRDYISIATPDSLRVSMVDIHNRQCRFPTSADGEAFHMCGHVTLRGRVYCNPHMQVAHIS